jgi:hypothetical protein
VGVDEGFDGDEAVVALELEGQDEVARLRLGLLEHVPLAPRRAGLVLSEGVAAVVHRLGGDARLHP